MVLSSVKIRPVERDEIQLLQQIGKQTFLDAFSDSCSPADMQQYLEEKFSLEQLIFEFEHPMSVYYFAELEEEIVGYLKINTGKAQTEDFLPTALEVERVYVLQEYQKKKVGQCLLDKAFELAKEMNLPTVWLGVWEHNEKAKRFYAKNGFSFFDTHAFQVGEEIQTDWLMKVDLE